MEIRGFDEEAVTVVETVEHKDVVNDGLLESGEQRSRVEVNPPVGKDPVKTLDDVAATEDVEMLTSDVDKRRRHRRRFTKEANVFC